LWDHPPILVDTKEALLSSWGATEEKEEEEIRWDNRGTKGEGESEGGD
jgi:hypothetical protein